MSGEGLSVSFKRISKTTKSNKELHEEFSKIILHSPATRHMKFYGERWSGHQGTIDLLEHGDKERQKWEQESVAIKDTFQFYISVYESWHEDADLYESHDREDSFVSLAKKFAEDNCLMYFPEGFPSEWITSQENGSFKHFIVFPNDKNIDKICELWLNDDWHIARGKIEEIMEKHDNYDYAI
jgi:hypothetical protein